MRLNRKMQEAMQRARGIVDTASTARISRILDLLWPSFIAVDGCILLERVAQHARLGVERLYARYKDRTGLEASLNHVHVEAHVEAFAEGPIEGLALGLRVVETWACKLKMEYPEYAFHIILSYDGEHTTLRFHRLRHEEEPWLEDDLEAYEPEAILVREI